MLPTTIEATRALLRTDPSLTPGDRDRLMVLLRSNSKSGLTNPTTKDTRIIRRAEVARMLSRSQRAVDMLAAAGVLQRVTLPGRTRAAGFRLSDVMALVEGGKQ